MLFLLVKPGNEASADLFVWTWKEGGAEGGREEENRAGRRGDN